MKKELTKPSDVGCPECHARPRTPCRSETGGSIKGYHEEREALLARRMARIKAHTTWTITLDDHVFSPVKVSRESLFQLVRDTWNLSEVVRLLDPQTKADCQFKTGVDPRWIAETRKGFTKLFAELGLTDAQLRNLFAPDECSDLIVPHVAFETEPTAHCVPKGSLLPAKIDYHWLLCPTCKGIRQVIYRDGPIGRDQWHLLVSMGLMPDGPFCSCHPSKKDKK